MASARRPVVDAPEPGEARPGRDRARRGFRFRPAPLAVGPELEWVLLRAFATRQPPAPADPERAVALASDLDLTARIGARTEPAALRREVGASAERVTGAYHRAAAQVAQLDGLARLAARRAERLGVPVAVLKGSALRALHITALGARRAGDVDLLVPADRAEDVQRDLIAAGLTPNGGRAAPHQLEALAHASGVLVEVHRELMGVRAGGERWARLGRLLELDLLRPCPALGQTALCPTRELLGAHLLARGIAQHGLKPESYPFFRLLADLADLAPTPSELDQAHRLIAADVSRDEVDAVAGLVRALVAGDLGGLTDGPAMMLAHAVRGAVESAYRDSLRFEALSPGLSDQPPARLWSGFLLRAAFPSRAGLELRYGRRGRLALALLRLWRPFDLVLRLVGHGARSATYRLRARSSAAISARQARG